MVEAKKGFCGMSGTSVSFLIFALGVMGGLSMVVGGTLGMAIPHVGQDINWNNLMIHTGAIVGVLSGLQFLYVLGWESRKIKKISKMGET